MYMYFFFFFLIVNLAFLLHFNDSNGSFFSMGPKWRAFCKIDFKWNTYQSTDLFISTAKLSLISFLPVIKILSFWKSTHIKNVPFEIPWTSLSIHTWLSKFSQLDCRFTVHINCRRFTLKTAPLLRFRLCTWTYSCPSCSPHGLIKRILFSLYGRF